MFQLVDQRKGCEILSSSAIALCFGAIAFSSLSASADEPFKENGKVYIGGFVPGEAVSVIYENLNFAKDFVLILVAHRQKRGGRHSILFDCGS